LEEKNFLDSLSKSMQDSARQVRILLGRPSSQATRQQALQQVETLLVAKKAAQQTGK
jgi:hypothetical protein